MNISWGQFLAMITILLIIYYAIVIMLFYREEVYKLFGKGSAKEGTIGVGEREEKVVEETIDVLEAVIADLNGILVKAGKEAGKRELLRQLSERLANYAGFRHPAFRVAIINYVIKNAQSLCEVTYSSGELEQAWQALPH